MARLAWDEVFDLGRRLAAEEINVDQLVHDDRLDADDRRHVFDHAVALLRERHQRIRRQKLGPGQRRAMKLLRTLLTPEQCRQLASNRSFVVTLASGRSYRFRPNMGSVQLVVRHGVQWIDAGRYCYHEAPDDLLADQPDLAGLLTVPAIPPADRVIGILLLLLADEDRFLAEANWTEVRPNHGWDSEWMTRRAAIRREARELAAERGITYEEAMDERLDLRIARHRVEVVDALPAVQG